MNDYVLRILFELEKLLRKLEEEGFEVEEGEIERKFSEIKEELGEWLAQNTLAYSKHLECHDTLIRMSILLSC